jgi:hypothetical protein
MKGGFFGSIVDSSQPKEEPKSVQKSGANNVVPDSKIKFPA